MEMDRGISRRRMLAMSAAAGGVALGGDVGRAFAQTDKRIEQLAPELDKIIATSEPIKELATGFGGPLGPAEGRCGGRKAASCCSRISTTAAA